MSELQGLPMSPANRRDQAIARFFEELTELAKVGREVLQEVLINAQEDNARQRERHGH